MNEQQFFNEEKNKINSLGFSIVDLDLERPWGGFFVIDEKQAKNFFQIFFKELNENEFTTYTKLSPKILLIEPHKKLSWQYHNRRSEIWKCLTNQVKIITSLTNIEEQENIILQNEIVKIEQGKRHRIVGLNQWATIAEIWQHTNILEPSNEEDIIRLQDDFGR